MKPSRLLLLLVVLFILLSGSARAATAQEPPPVVHAVLFYSPTCGHCEYVINEVFPPLYDLYGSQLQILGFDVTHPQGQAMFYSALERYDVQEASVPFLVIDDITLVGSVQIPEDFPPLIEAYLAHGGSPWPDIPGLQEMLVAAAQTASAEAPVPPEADARPNAAPQGPDVAPLAAQEVGWRQRFALDPLGNSIAVIVLVGLIAALIWGSIMFRNGQGRSLSERPRSWMIPLLCLGGAAVAAYLAYVEGSGVDAVCGPIGDCNTVQQSPYARLFGIISVGALGLMAFIAMGVAFGVARLQSERRAGFASLALFALAMLGTLFSAYLTFLEPFVIGATCAWCVTSAAIMATLLLLSAGPAGAALGRLGVVALPPTSHRRHQR